MHTNTIEALFSVDADLRIATWSREAEWLWGWTPEDALGMPARRLVPDRNAERYERHLLTPLTHLTSSVPRDVTAVHHDGREFKVTLSLSAAHRDGAAIDVCVVGMSPSAFAEGSFNPSADHFRAIVNQITDGCSVVDLLGNYLLVNPAYCQLYGLNAADILGRNFREHLSGVCTPAVMAAVHEVHAEVYRTGRPIRGFEFELLRNGEVFTVAMSVSLDRNAQGQPIGFNDISRDVTRRARAEREAVTARLAAEEANRAKSEFLANMSHEIRTPMNGILGMTELALATPLNDVQRDYLQTVHGSALSLLAIINDILDFSKIEAGRLDIEAIDFSLRALVDEAIRPLALRAHQKLLELAVDIPSSVPDRLVGDPLRLRQVIVNLVSNAIKFTDHGEVVLRVTATPTADNRTRLHVHVTDTGIGLAPERQPAVFQPFVQADGSTTRRFGGTGLGLTISARLIELMGGRIWCESEVGRGSDFQFEILLPCGTPAPPPTLVDRGSLAGLAALVVDDNDTNLRILRETVDSWGMTVVAARDAESATAAVTSSSVTFSLAIIDARLGSDSGLELAAALRQLPRCSSAAVLVLTSSDSPGEAQGVVGLGNARYLIKPVGPALLLRHVTEALGARSMPELQAAAPEGTPMRSARHLRVLVAEDNAVNCKLADYLLRRRGHEPVIVGTGRAATEAVAAERFDLVLMDLQMPEMDGFEATATIRRMQRGHGVRTPIIALTAHAMAGDRQRCLDADMDGYVSKPIKAVELFEVIDRVMAASGNAPLPTA